MARRVKKSTKKNPLSEKLGKALTRLAKKGSGSVKVFVDRKLMATVGSSGQTLWIDFEHRALRSKKRRKKP